MLRIHHLLLLSVLALPCCTRANPTHPPSLSSASATIPIGTVETEFIDSTNLRDTRTGVDPRRRVKTYLPPSYASSPHKRYPVVYWFHGFFWDNERMFADGNFQRTLNRSIAEGVIGEVIFVAADFSTPGPGSFYENSSTTGHWIDFIVQELVPFVDAKYRTLAHKDSRALAGEMIGAYGALKIAMLYPDKFSMAYGLHPVATGTGYIPMAARPDWAKVHSAKNFSDLSGDPFSAIFTAMAQAYAPNPNRPPFYCDFMVEPSAGGFEYNVKNAQQLMRAFLLDYMIEEHVENLRKLRGIAFDWGRYDANQDHVLANQRFTRRLDELGIEHYAEEYRGNPWEKNWIPEGRVVCDVLPFFNRRLVFER